jgi:selenocysteine lyase/cysteine desulfurase
VLAPTGIGVLYGKPEAGTGSIADAVGLGAALEYVSQLGLPNRAVRTSAA